MQGEKWGKTKLCGILIAKLKLNTDNFLYPLKKNRKRS